MSKITDRQQGDANAPQGEAVRVDALPSSLQVTLDDIEHPAYMLNKNFELIWINEHAHHSLFGRHVELPQTSDQRNLFRLLPLGRQEWGSLLGFHIGIAKSLLTPDCFAKLCRGLDPVTYAHLQSAYLEGVALPAGPVIQSTVILPDLNGGREEFRAAYAMLFREGIFIVLAKENDHSEELIRLLARRDDVIRGLLRKQLPVLTDLAVLVADLQGSMKICSELPPEEYFELINEIWRVLAPTFRKYRGTYGKHVGDGMLYYFFPQPDSNYLTNALECALEIRQEMQRLSKSWQIRKQWFNELYLNSGITEGQEWLGTYQSPTSVEFVVLGNTINQASRISDFARFGAIWATKSLIGKLAGEERSRVVFGVRRRSPDGREVFVPASFSQVSTLLEQDAIHRDKLLDIANLPIAEIVEIKPRS